MMEAPPAKAAAQAARRGGPSFVGLTQGRPTRRVETRTRAVSGSGQGRPLDP